MEVHHGLSRQRLLRLHQLLTLVSVIYGRSYDDPRLGFESGFVENTIDDEWNDQGFESGADEVSEISRAAKGKCLFQSSSMFDATKTKVVVEREGRGQD